MPTLLLPHTQGCLVCGRDNPHGLRLSLEVELDSNTIQTVFTPSPQHIGFVGVIHGGVLATVADEAMVWAAIWSSRRSCLAAEMTMRFKQKARVGEPLRVTASVVRSARRLIESSCEITDAQGLTMAVASGKYMPLTEQDTNAFLATLVNEVSCSEAIRRLASG